MIGVGWLLEWGSDWSGDWSGVIEMERCGYWSGAVIGVGR